MQIGLRFYKLNIYNNYKSYKCDPAVPPCNIPDEIRNFIKKYQNKPLVRQASNEDGAEGEKRSHRFIIKKDDGHSIHGLIRYGTFGYATEVENVDTGVLSHSRTTIEADTIPLYHRFWWPVGYSYGLWAFQSYSGRSCGSAILSEFRSVYKEKFPDWKFEALKIVPSELQQYAKSKVTKITLVKKRTSSQTVIAALRPQSLQTQVDVELEVKARGGTFGQLKDMKERLAGNMDAGGVEYDSAYATIMVDKKPKKIGVIGVSSNTGVIDVTSNVDRDKATMMPKFNSIAAAVKEEMMDFAARLGN